MHVFALPAHVPMAAVVEAPASPHLMSRMPFAAVERTALVGVAALGRAAAAADASTCRTTSGIAARAAECAVARRAARLGCAFSALVMAIARPARRGATSRRTD